MPTDASLLFLNELLEGNRPTEARIHELLDQRVEEDLHLDYKTGAWVDPASRKKKGSAEDKPPARLRKYIAGFANGEGGVIVIGVGEPPQEYAKRPVEPITIWKSAEDGERWLSDCASTLRPFLSPPPRVYVIDAAAGGHLAVVAVPRAHALVACEVKQRLVHFFRLHDKTLEVPSYLVEDLVLGRRQKPVLAMSSAFGLNIRGTNRGDVAVEISPQPTLGNIGLTWLEQPVAFVLGPGKVNASSPTFDAWKRRLLSGVEVGTMGGHPIAVTRGQSYLSGPSPGVEPFGEVGFRWNPNNPLKLSLPQGRVRWGGAAAVVARGMPPVWFQLECSFTIPIPLNPRQSTPPRAVQHSARVVVGELPKIFVECE